MTPKRYPLVHVVWVDPVTPEHGGWITPKNMRKTKLAKMKSVGWLVLDVEDRIGICTCYQIASEELGAVTIIPRGLVKKIEVLVPAKD